MPETDPSALLPPDSAGESTKPSYHDLHITTAEIPRTSIFNLPYSLQVSCSRTTGWQLWATAIDVRQWKVLAGEYEGIDKWLVLDVAGHVIVDSRRDLTGEEAGENEDHGRPA